MLDGYLGCAHYVMQHFNRSNRRLQALCVMWWKFCQYACQWQRGEPRLKGAAVGCEDFFLPQLCDLRPQCGAKNFRKQQCAHDNLSHFLTISNPLSAHIKRREIGTYFPSLEITNSVSQGEETLFIRASQAILTNTRVWVPLSAAPQKAFTALAACHSDP